VKAYAGLEELKRWKESLPKAGASSSKAGMNLRSAWINKDGDASGYA
jgi:hypothetical protein